MNLYISGVEMTFYQCYECDKDLPCVVAVDENYCNIIQCAMNDGMKPTWRKIKHDHFFIAD